MQASESIQDQEREQVWPKVAIVVLNWNGWRDTIECLESVYQNKYPNFQVVVIDNGSTNESVRKIKDWAEGREKPFSKFYKYNPHNKPIQYIEYNSCIDNSIGDAIFEKSVVPIENHLIIIKTGSNLGFAGGNNVGIKYVIEKGDGEYVWLLNNDTVIDENALTEMVKLSEIDKRIGILGSKILYYDKPDVIQTMGGGRIVPWLGTMRYIGGGEKDNGQWDKNIEPDFIGGASLLVEIKKIEKIGLLDEGYFFYGEDSDWSERAKRKGFILCCSTKSRVWHKVGRTVGRQSSMYDYYLTKNSLIFFRKYYSRYFIFSSLASFLIKTFLRIKRGQFQNLNLLAILRAYKDFMQKK